MASDLERRLRSRLIDDARRESADALAAQAAEIERLNIALKAALYAKGEHARDLGEALVRADALAARVAKLEAVLQEAREEILHMAHSRGSEIEGTDAEIASFIDDVLHPKTPAPAGEGGES